MHSVVLRVTPDSLRRIVEPKIAGTYRKGNEPAVLCGRGRAIRWRCHEGEIRPKFFVCDERFDLWTRAGLKADGR